MLVLGNGALGSLTRQRWKQIDQKNHAFIQPFAGGGAIKRGAKQSFNIDWPKRDRDKKPIVEFSKIIEIGVIGPPETVKCSNQIFAIFEADDTQARQGVSGHSE